MTAAAMRMMSVIMVVRFSGYRLMEHAQADESDQRIAHRLDHRRLAEQFELTELQHQGEHADHHDGGEPLHERDHAADDDPIGQQIKFNVLDQMPEMPHDAYFEIVGVVRDVRYSWFNKDVVPTIYRSYRQSAPPIQAAR